MARIAHSNSGQASLPEYVVTFFLVVAVIVAMSVYVQRGLQARIRDMRNYAVDTASKNCDTDCKIAAGLTSNRNIPYEYEPYYGLVVSQTKRLSDNNSVLVGIGQEGLYKKTTNEQTNSQTFSMQLPPREAAHDKF